MSLDLKTKNVCKKLRTIIRIDFTITPQWNLLGILLWLTFFYNNFYGNQLHRFKKSPVMFHVKH